MTDTPASAPITPAMLHILLAIAGGAQHGYGIMREVSDRTQGATELGAGTLYRSIKKMLEAEWIEESGSAEANSLGPARREYQITDRGRRAASSEVAQLHGIVEWARSSSLIDPGEST
jgi:DNA-binding PadR family transcriptional regulator